MKSLREKLKCEAKVPDRAIAPLLQMYHGRSLVGRAPTMDEFVASVKRRMNK